MNKEPEANSHTTFTDVVSGSYYQEAVKWAAKNGIANGTGGGAFSPNNVCSRAAIVTFLYRNAEN